MTTKEIVDASNQQDEWKKMADDKLDHILVQQGKGRKRRPKQLKQPASKKRYAKQSMASSPVASPKLYVSTGMC